MQDPHQPSHFNASVLHINRGNLLQKTLPLFLLDMMDSWPGQTNQIRGEQIEFQVGFYD